MAEEFNIPDFLDRDFADIMDEMTADMPEDIDMSGRQSPLQSHSADCKAGGILYRLYFSRSPETGFSKVL